MLLLYNDKPKTLYRSGDITELRLDVPLVENNCRSLVNRYESQAETCVT